MKRLFTFLLLITSTQLFAKNEIQILLEQKSNRTPYEILSSFHEREDGVAVKLDELNSFNLDDGSRKTNFTNCAVAHSDDTTPRSAELAVFFKTKKIPGTPSNGPLFPGTPDTFILQSGLTFATQYLNENYSYQIQALLDNSEWKQFESSTTTFDASFNSPLMNYENHSEIKKHGELISYYYSIVYMNEDGTKKESSRTYGYCWNN